MIVRRVRQVPLRRAIMAVAALCSTAGGAAPARATAPVACVGDCAPQGSVGVDDVVTMVRIALGEAAVASCAAGDADGSGAITVDEIVAAVRNVLDGCPPLALQARIRFDQPREPINQELTGTSTPSPLLVVNDLLRTLQLPWMRLDVYFDDSGCPDGSHPGSLYDAASNTFDYCQLDERLRSAQAAGTRPLVIIDYMPPALADPACAATNGNGDGTSRCPPADYARFAALVQATIVHTYTIWGVTDFEVWNEPDWTFFAGKLSDYLMLYDACSAAIDAAEQQLQLAPGTLHLGGPAAFVADTTWIGALARHAVAHPTLRLDFISWHMYANNPLVPPPDPFLSAGAYADATAKVRNALAPYLAQRADLHPLLWIDEWNVNAFYDARMDTAYGAGFTVATMHAMQDAGLDRAARFFTWDTTPASPAGFNGNWGLFTNDAQVRPVFHAVAFWRQLAATRVAVELLDSAAQQRDLSSQTRYQQNLIAALDPSGQSATILLYDFIPYSPALASPPYCGDGLAVQASLDLQGLADGTYRVTQRRVDCSTPIAPAGAATLAEVTTSLTVVDQHATVTVDAPADGVVQLTLQRDGTSPSR